MRLELWQPTKTDVPEMFAIVSTPATHRCLGGMANRADNFARFQRGVGSWFLHGYGSLMVRLKDDPHVIGNCGVFHSFKGLGEDFDDKPRPAGSSPRNTRAKATPTKPWKLSSPGSPANSYPARWCA